MTKVHSYTPAWLSRPSPGFQLFNSAAQSQDAAVPSWNRVGTQFDYDGPNRTIARRDTEVFVVVGKQIRWADLPSLKDSWAAIQETPSKKPKGKGVVKIEEEEETQEYAEDGSYRVLKVSIGEPIRQLCISPNQKLMAIVTSHTVQIAILPQPDLLNAQHNKEPLKLKTYTIGPTTHVLSQSPIATVLWHPLGEGGNSLITITKDSVVRLWEFDTDNRWSADSPASALDLKKLMIANSEQDDVAPYRSNRNKVFTSDAAGMEMAAACFGGGGYVDEASWSAMTLWVAMTDGDVYALCPFLPSRFQPPTDLLPKLSGDVLEKEASLEEDTEGTYEARQIKEQLRWLHDLDDQQPAIRESSDPSRPIESYKRPTLLSSVPRLQGPFETLPEGLEDDLELTDIYVIPAKSKVPEESDDSDDESESDWDKDEQDNLSCSLVSLITREGRIYNCIDLQGVEAQWLPRKLPSRPAAPPPDPFLVVLEALDTLKPGEAFPTEWPTFTPDTQSHYSFFITNSRGVYHLSLDPWLHNLEQELQSPSTSGVNFRLSTLRSTTSSTRTRILSLVPSDQHLDIDPTVPSALIFSDSDLGHFLLTTLNSQPHAALLSDSAPLYPTENTLSPTVLPQNDDYNTLHPSQAYPPYQPPDAFYAPSALPRFTQTHVPARHKSLLDKDVVLSTATLDIFTEAHRVLSRESQSLGFAAADLFRRCATLLEILQTQITKVQEIGEKVESVTVKEGDESVEQAIARRIERAKDRQESLDGRCEDLRRKLREGVAGRELSLREREWVGEIAGVAGKVLEEEEKEGEDGEHQGGEDGEDGEEGDERDEGEVPEHLARFKEVQELHKELVQQAKEITASSAPDDNTQSSSTDERRAEQDDESSVPLNIQKKKKEEVRKMLAKQSMLVNEVQAKLEGLNVGGLSLS